MQRPRSRLVSQHRFGPRDTLRPAAATVPVVEPLEDRRLWSVTVPAGYVAVQTLTLDAVTLATQSIPVSADRDYFFKASGTHLMSTTPPLHADAAGIEPYTSLWSDKTASTSPRAATTSSTGGITSTTMNTARSTTPTARPP